VGLASTRLQSSCAFLKASTANRQNQIEAAERELVACDNQESDLRIEVTMVEAKKEWMEEFRGWVEMLGGFLEEKVGKPTASTEVKR
jgi:GC-rich sequence DNA-binding factor